MITEQTLSGTKNSEKRRSATCAYCGSIRTKVTGVQLANDICRFTVFCNACRKVDLPMLTQEQLKYFLMMAG